MLHYDRQTPEDGYTLSSPCEPDGSGELKMVDGQADSRACVL